MECYVAMRKYEMMSFARKWMGLGRNMKVNGGLLAKGARGRGMTGWGRIRSKYTVCTYAQVTVKTLTLHNLYTLIKDSLFLKATFFYLISKAYCLVEFKLI
jgi:hypothetical protein